MRVLIIGAGAIGGYFGARLIEAGRDITFLVRPQRAAKLVDGLLVKSPAGDIKIKNPQTVTADKLKEHYDLILLACKAFDLEAAMDSMAPAVGPNTTILPFLNGMSHINSLNTRFGESKVLGGWSAISTTMNREGEILHLQPFHSVSYGEQAGGTSGRVDEITATLSGAKFDALPVETITLEMWEKWVFIATAAITGLMRGTVADILNAGAGNLAVSLLEECASISKAHGYEPRQPVLDRYKAMFTTPSPFTSSMMRDIEAGLPIEADQIVGEMLKRAKSVGQPAPLSEVVYAHLKAYEARRAREQQARSGQA